jgi:DNA transformation protein and related proteins
MAVSDSFRSFVLEQLNHAVPPVRARSMFGGVGLYAGEAFFALIAEDTLYLKTDESTKTEFESRGMPQFRPFGEEGSSMHYHQLPEEILEDPESLRAWAERAIAVARRAKTRPARRRRP